MFCETVSIFHRRTVDIAQPTDNQGVTQAAPACQWQPKTTIMKNRPKKTKDLARSSVSLVCYFSLPTDSWALTSFSFLLADHSVQRNFAEADFIWKNQPTELSAQRTISPVSNFRTAVAWSEKLSRKLLASLSTGVCLDSSSGPARLHMLPSGKFYFTWNRVLGRPAGLSSKVSASLEWLAVH